MKHKALIRPGDTPMSELRTDFEALAHECGWPLARKSDGTYDSHTTRRAYAAYRAGRQHPKRLAP